MLIRLIHQLVKKEPEFSKRAKEQFDQWTADLYYGKISFDDYTNNLVEAFKNWIKDFPYKILSEVGDDVAKSHIGLVFKYPLELFKKLKSDGEHYLAAISHSPYSVVNPFCNQMGFDKVYATNYETKIEGGDRIFTGEVNREIFDQDKGKAFEEIVKKENLDIEKSVGIGDSQADIKFLEKVRYPIAFNPDEGLEKWARERNCEIIFEDAQKLRIRYYKGRHHFYYMPVK